MNAHKNARTTPFGRAVMVRRVLEDGWTVAAAAGAFAVSTRTVRKWLARVRSDGAAGLQNRSSAPHLVANKLPAPWVDMIVRLRRDYRMTAEDIAGRLHLPRSTVAGHLARRGLGRLAQLEPSAPARRYNRARAGALASLLRYGFVVALVVIVLGFALALYQTQRTTVDADDIISDFKVATEAAAASQSKLDAIARLQELQDSNAFRAAVVALVGQSKNPNAPRGIDRALELLRQGETGAAETALAEILDQRLQERATASAEAAEAARNLGAIAYLNDTDKAIAAYEQATQLEPGDTWSWIFLGRLYQRAGSLAAAEQAFEKAREAAERAGDERDVMVAGGEPRGRAARAGQPRRRAQGLPGQPRHRREARRAGPEQHRVAARPLGQLQQDRRRAARAGQSRRRAQGLSGQTSPSPRSWPRRTRATPSGSATSRSASIKIGDVQSARGNLDAALKAYQDSLAIAEKLAAQDPSNTEWQRDLSVSFDRIGDVQSARGNLDAALKAYQDSLAIREKLAAQDPSNTEWQRDLSVSFDRIGDVQSARGNLDAALEAYQDSLAIAEKLAARDPSNTGWQRDLSVSINKVGDVQSAQGNLDAALKAYQDGLAIRERLAAQDPSNAGWQRDVWVSMWRLAQIDGGGVSWTEVLERMEAMKARGVLLPTDEPLLEQARAQSTP